MSAAAASAPVVLTASAAPSAEAIKEKSLDSNLEEIFKWVGWDPEGYKGFAKLLGMSVVHPGRLASMPEDL